MSTVTPVQITFSAKNLAYEIHRSFLTTYFLFWVIRSNANSLLICALWLIVLLDCAIDRLIHTKCIRQLSVHSKNVPLTQPHSLPYIYVENSRFFLIQPPRENVSTYFFFYFTIISIANYILIEFHQLLGHRIIALLQQCLIFFIIYYHYSDGKFEITNQNYFIETMKMETI